MEPKHVSGWACLISIPRIRWWIRQFETLLYKYKFPTFIYKNHYPTMLIIWYFYLIILHSRPKLVLSLTCQRFWFPDGRCTVRCTVKKEIRECIQCIHFNAKAITQIMEDLPKDRITPVRDFHKVIFDFSCPIFKKC